MSPVRPAAVSGLFYPAAPDALRRELVRCLDRAISPSISGGVAPKALVVPHAGYIYSGEIAAAAYILLKESRETIRNVILLGPAHRVRVPGLALPDATAFETPLGRIGLDRAGIAAIAGLPQITVSAAAHAEEHSLEVQLPFLQWLLDDFTVLPLLAGGAAPAQVAEVLQRVWGGEETLIVVSSDLSHFLSYAVAQRRDAMTVQAMLELATDLTGDQACGAVPFNGFALAARQHGLSGRLLDLRNSGDTSGDHSRVVGYAAMAFGE
jgi:MEMO1 family protein